MRKKILLSIIIITLFSCKKETVKPESKKEIPEALEDKSFSRGSSRGNLVEELYQDLVSKSPELQKLETEIDNFKTDEVQKKFYNYNSKSENYYSSAKYQAKDIKDSITRKKNLAFIEKSNNQYFEKNEEITGLFKTINDKQKSIEDCHTVLKIVLTMPIMVKYQNENLPAKKEFENKIKSEDSLINKIQSRTPKY